MITSLIPEGFKKCTKCLKVKAVGDFPLDHARLSGVKSWCKECANESRRLHYSNNRKHVIEKVRIYQDNKKEILQLKAKDYYEENAEIQNVRSHVNWMENILLDFELGFLNL